MFRLQCPANMMISKKQVHKKASMTFLKALDAKKAGHF
jgi:hypothetical protein